MDAKKHIDQNTNNNGDKNRKQRSLSKRLFIDIIKIDICTSASFCVNT